MNLKTRHFFLGILLLQMPLVLFAQSDVHFSQFYETSIIRNPALVGVFTDNFKLTGYTRTQWSSVTDPYQTALANGEYRLTLSSTSNDFLSFGLLAFMDKAGAINQKISGFYPAINYNKCLNEEDQAYLSMGFTGGYMQYSFDPSKATFNNQFQGGFFSPTNSPNENLPIPRFSYTDLGAGMNFNMTPRETESITYIVGAAAYHFNQPLFTYYHVAGRSLNIRFNVNGAVLKELNDIVVLQFQGNYARQGAYEEIVAGGMVGLKSYARSADPAFEMYAGVYYRNQDAVIPVVKVVYKKVSVGVSYDVNVSSLHDASNNEGGFEITMSFSGNYPPTNGIHKKTVCPRF